MLQAAGVIRRAEDGEEEGGTDVELAGEEGGGESESGEPVERSWSDNGRNVEEEEDELVQQRRPEGNLIVVKLVHLPDVEKCARLLVVDRKDLSRSVLPRLDDVSGSTLGEEGRHEVVIGAVTVEQTCERVRRGGEVGGGKEQVAGENNEVGLYQDSGSVWRTGGRWRGNQTYGDETLLRRPLEHSDTAPCRHFLRDLLKLDLRTRVARRGRGLRATGSEVVCERLRNGQRGEDEDVCVERVELLLNMSRAGRGRRTKNTCFLDALENPVNHLLPSNRQQRLRLTVSPPVRRQSRLDVLLVRSEVGGGFNKGKKILSETGKDDSAVLRFRVVGAEEGVGKHGHGVLELLEAGLTRGEGGDEGRGGQVGTSLRERRMVSSGLWVE